MEKVEELQRGKEGRDSFLGTADSGVDDKHRTTLFCALEHMRVAVINQPPLWTAGFWQIDAYSGVLRAEDWALEVGGGRVRDTGNILIIINSSSGSSTTGIIVVCGGRGSRRQKKSYRERNTQRVSPIRRYYR